MMPNYPKVDYKSMGKSLTQDVAGSYQSPGSEYGPDLTPNPYEFGVAGQVEGGAYDNQYGGFNQALAQKLMGMGNKDYSGQINAMAQRGIDRQTKQQKAKFAGLGMSELFLQQDVQDDWSQRRTDATTKANITGAELQRQGLMSAVQGIQSMSSTDLNYALGKTRALLGGGQQWLQYQQLLAPMMNKMGGSSSWQGKPSSFGKSNWGRPSSGSKKKKTSSGWYMPKYPGR